MSLARMTSLTTSAKFDWLDAVMADHRLTARARIVAYWIMQHVNRQTGTAFVSDDTLRDRTGIPKVLRFRAELHSAGWINWKRTSTANVYSLLEGQLQDVSERQQMLRAVRHQKRRRDMPPAAQHDVPPVGQQLPPDVPPAVQHVLPPTAQHDVPPVGNIPLRNNPVVLTPESKSPSMLIPSEFENFWATFPRRVAKARAEKAYLDIIKAKKATHDELLVGAQRYAAERAGEDPQYTKHPATWLNGGCWKDEPTARSKFIKPNRADSVIAGLCGYLEEGPHE